MNNFASFSLGPTATPKIIKSLIVLSLLIAIASIGIQELTEIFNIFPGPQTFLSLSWWGFYHGYLWQIVTFVFIQNPSQVTLSFSFLFLLGAKIYALWIVGCTLIQIIGNKTFLLLYFLGSLLAGLLTLLSMKFTGQYEMIEGMAPAIIIMTTVWAMALPETKVLLFSLLSIKTKWIGILILGYILLTDLINWQLSSLILTLTSISVGYAYSTLFQEWTSPFPITEKFDRALFKIRDKIFDLLPIKKKPIKLNKTVLEGKIIDISSALEDDNDDLFVQAMLTKISKTGEKSLSWYEKRRLKKITDSKMHRPKR